MANIWLSVREHTFAHKISTSTLICPRFSDSISTNHTTTHVSSTPGVFGALAYVIISLSIISIVDTNHISSCCCTLIQISNTSCSSFNLKMIYPKFISINTILVDRKGLLSVIGDCQLTWQTRTIKSAKTKGILSLLIRHTKHLSIFS